MTTPSGRSQSATVTQNLVVQAAASATISLTIPGAPSGGRAIYFMAIGNGSWADDTSLLEMRSGSGAGYVLSGWRPVSGSSSQATVNHALADGSAYTLFGLAYAQAAGSGGSAQETQELFIADALQLFVSWPDAPDEDDPDVIGNVGQEFAGGAQTSGGWPDYVFTATGLPPGTEFDPVTGELSGVPLADGSYTVTITVTDGHGDTASETRTFTIGAALPLLIDHSRFPLDINTGTQWDDIVLSASGGLQPYAWMVTGLPPGLEFSGNLITGTAREPGQYHIVLQVTDALGTTTTEIVRVYVHAAPASVIWCGFECSPGNTDDPVTGGQFTSVVTAVDGWYDSPPLNGNDIELVLTDGGAWGPKVRQARVITLTGGAAGPLHNLRELRDKLTGLAAELQPCELTITDATGPGMTALVRADTDSFKHSFIGGNAGFTWTVTLTAVDPRLYGPWRVADLHTAGEHAGTGRSYPRAYSWSYGSVEGLPNAVFLDNPGNVDAPVELLYHGPLEESRITDGTPANIRLSGLGGGVEIYVHSDTLAAEAPGGASRAGYIRPGSMPLMVPPGGATWSLYGSGLGRVTLAWRPAWA